MSFPVQTVFNGILWRRLPSANTVEADVGEGLVQAATASSRSVSGLHPERNRAWESTYISTIVHSADAVMALVFCAYVKLLSAASSLAARVKVLMWGDKLSS
jgi:hypothetical protein